MLRGRFWRISRSIFPSSPTALTKHFSDDAPIAANVRQAVIPSGILHEGRAPIAALPLGSAKRLGLSGRRPEPGIAHSRAAKPQSPCRVHELTRLRRQQTARNAPCSFPPAGLKSGTTPDPARAGWNGRRVLPAPRFMKSLDAACRLQAKCRGTTTTLWGQNSTCMGTTGNSRAIVAIL